MMTIYLILAVALVFLALKIRKEWDPELAEDNSPFRKIIKN